MKLTIICHLAAFIVSDYTYEEKGGQMTNDCKFHVLLCKYEIYNR